MNNNFIDDLNQIRARQTDVLDSIEQLKLDANGHESVDLFNIRSEAQKVLDQIDEIKRRCEDDSHTITKAGKSDGSCPD